MATTKKSLQLKAMKNGFDAIRSMKAEEWDEALDSLQAAIEIILVEFDTGPANTRADVTGLGVGQSHGNSGFVGGCTGRVVPAT